MKRSKGVSGRWESRWCFALSRWKETEWVELKKRNERRVKRRETVGECIREANYTADYLISLLLLQYFKNYNFLEVHFVKMDNGAWKHIKPFSINTVCTQQEKLEYFKYLNVIFSMMFSFFFQFNLSDLHKTQIKQMSHRLYFEVEKLA